MPKNSLSQRESTMLTVRLHTELMDRIDALIPVFTASSQLSPSGETTRADVVRSLLLVGLASFEGDES